MFVHGAPPRHDRCAFPIDRAAGFGSIFTEFMVLTDFFRKITSDSRFRLRPFFRGGRGGRELHLLLLTFGLFSPNLSLPGSRSLQHVVFPPATPIETSEITGCGKGASEGCLIWDAGSGPPAPSSSSSQGSRSYPRLTLARMALGTAVVAILAGVVFSLVQAARTRAGQGWEQGMTLSRVSLWRGGGGVFGRGSGGSGTTAGGVPGAMGFELPNLRRMQSTGEGSDQDSFIVGQRARSGGQGAQRERGPGYARLLGEHEDGGEG